MVAAAVDDAVLAEEHGPAPGVEDDQPGQGTRGVRGAQEVAFEAAPGGGVEGDPLDDQAVPLRGVEHLRSQVRRPRVAVQALQQAAPGLLAPGLEGAARVAGPPALGVQVEGAVGADAPHRLLEAAVVAVGRAGEGEVAEAGHGVISCGQRLGACCDGPVEAAVPVLVAGIGRIHGRQGRPEEVVKRSVAGIRRECWPLRWWPGFWLACCMRDPPCNGGLKGGPCRRRVKPGPLAPAGAMPILSRPPRIRPNELPPS